MDVDPVAIAQLAARQHGKVAVHQLVDLGMPPEAVHYRGRTGAFIRDHRGVYAIGHVPDTRESRWSGAVLAAGRDAALSHLAAARLWNLLRWEPDRIDVSRPHRTRPIAGVHVHNTRLESHEITSHDGIAVTSPSRTIADCAQLLPVAQLTPLLREARHLGLLDLEQIAEYASPVRRRHGAPCLREALSQFNGRSSGFRSRLEQRVRDVLVTRGAPEPLVNVVYATDIGAVEADLTWPDLNVCVEVDGPTHDDALQQRADQRNRAALHRAGWKVFVVDHAAFRACHAAATDHALAAIWAQQMRAQASRLER
jgi:very-short-patch-repair endonuclease